MERKSDYELDTSNDNEMRELRFLEMEGLDLLASFKRIVDPKVRQAVAKFIGDLAGSAESQ